ncbi:MAG: glycosyltransferase family 4 protein [Chitinispirillia bacterium]|nr:glycosyltransferase family 4 protein [Chitinispirillia bacterium]MCL2241908.1 glycosyltransferase family 4 protein [Chitinispirillia bacterium]
MNIGINASALSAQMGGASLYILKIINALAQVDHENSYFIFTTAAGKAHFSNLPQTFSTIPCAPSKTITRLLWEQTVLPLAVCKKYKIRVLFSPNYTAPLFHPGVRSAVTIHDLSFFPMAEYYPRSRRIFRHIIRLSVKHSDRVISVSHFTKDDILKYVGAYEKKIRVIHVAADTRFLNEPPEDDLRQLRQKYKINNGYVLFIGFMEPRKNLERLLCAFAAIKDKIAHDLVIVGGHGWWYEQTYRRVEELGISGRVVFTGYAEDSEIPLFYRGAALFAFTSLYEGFGAAALESVFSDTPVLASDNSALPEVLGTAAAYVDPFNTDEIAEKMLHLLTSESALAELKKNCADVKVKYSWQKTARETLDVFNEYRESPSTKRPHERAGSNE